MAALPGRMEAYPCSVKACRIEIGTVCWPNGADLDPDVLYAELTGSSLGLRKIS